MDKAFPSNQFSEDVRRKALALGFQETRLLEHPDGTVAAYTKVAHSQNAKHVYLSAGIHGDEPAGSLAILELLNKNFFEDYFTWTVCPMLNPYGLKSNIRENADGIDLNRDYLERLSKEVSAHTAWLETQTSPDLFLSLHEDWESTGFYLYEIQLQEQQSHVPALLKKVQDLIPIEPERIIDNHKTREPGWIFHTPQADFQDLWPEAIFIAKLGCPLSLTLETPSSLELETRISVHIQAVETAVSLYLE